MQKPGKAHILHDNTVNSKAVDVIAVIKRPRQLMVGYESVDRHIYFDSMGMSIVYGIGKLFIAEIVSENPGIECHAAHVNRIGAVINCGDQMRFASHR